MRCAVCVHVKRARESGQGTHGARAARKSRGIPLPGLLRRFCPSFFVCAALTASRTPHSVIAPPHVCTRVWGLGPAGRRRVPLPCRCSCHRARPPRTAGARWLRRRRGHGAADPDAYRHFLLSSARHTQQLRNIPCPQKWDNDAPALAACAQTPPLGARGLGAAHA